MYTTQKKVLIDNPSDEKVIIQTKDISNFEINSDQSKELIVKFGDVELIVDNKKTYKFNLGPDYEYLINPTSETYYIETIHLFTSQRGKDDFDKEFGQLKSTVEGFEVTGQFERIGSTIAIKKTWTFGFDEEPTINGRIKTSSNKGYYKFKKIHRKKDISRKLISQMLDGIKLSEEINSGNNE